MGVSVVIPERANHALLALCLTSLAKALAKVAEPTEVIVVVNGSPTRDYEHLQAEYPRVSWRYSRCPLGFVQAVEIGIAAARYGAVYLLNNDMVIEPDTISQLLPWRGPTVFAIASQIFFQDLSKRREETGWTELRFGTMAELVDVPPEQDGAVRGHLYAGGGSSLFHRDRLRGMLRSSHDYHPFYWEDAEWGLRAWRDGQEVLFCPNSKVWHHHRATVSLFFKPAEIDRIFARNGLLFTLRNAVRPLTPDTAVDLARHAGPDTLSELTTLRRLLGILMARWRAASAPFCSIDFAHLRSKHYLVPAAGDPRPAVLVVTPYALLPARHGSARRTVGLADALKDRWRIVVLSDEEAIWSNIVGGPFSEVHLVKDRRDDDGSRIGRMRSHAHPLLSAEFRRLLWNKRPKLVQVEHSELLPLVELKNADGEDWIWAAHDVLLTRTGTPATEADILERTLAARFDAIVVCSEEDRALLAPLRAVVVPNGAALHHPSCAPSKGRTSLLFAGPFRYRPNLQGLRSFLIDAFPAIRARRPETRLVVLGGSEATSLAASDPLLGQPGIDMFDSMDDVRPFLEDCALTLNPLMEIRGSSIKLIESLAAGRVCVGTVEGARGFLDAGFPGLLAVPEIAQMASVIIDLLENEERRLQLERPDPLHLARFGWTAAASRLECVWNGLLSAEGHRQ